MNISADIRGLLQYVPEFRGNVFVVDLDWSEGDDALKAEILMDLTALQKVGVKLVISISEAMTSSFYDYSTEVEFRVSSAVRTLHDSDVIEVLERGQAVMVARQDELLSDALIHLSIQLNAKKIIVVSEGAPILEKGEVVNFIHISKLPQVDTNSPILTKSREACIKGIPRIHLLDIQRPGVILSELFSTEGVGTMIYTDSYRKVRLLKDEDISEMLSMIGRSVRNTHLVPRTYEEVKENISDYYVMEVDDNVVGCGALYEYDDYIVKPFSVRELLARVDAVLRRTTERSPQVEEFDFGRGTASFSRREILYSEDNSKEDLSDKETDLLHYLVANSGRAIARDEILRQVWNLDPKGISTRTIDMHIAHLRSKLKDDEQSILQTVRGKGYMIAAEKALNV